MSKHALSPAPLPPSKRLHTSTTPDIQTGLKRPFSFDDSLYDELILCIFSHLSWADLCVVQSINRNWSRLAADQELWRNLYLKVFGRSRLRGARGFTLRPDGREVKHLPSRANSTPDVFKDWKWMFRISSNWRRGRCIVQHLDGPSNTNPPYNHHRTLVILAGPLTITVSSQPSNRPIINVFNLLTISRALPCESRHTSRPFQITSLAIDQSPPSLGRLRLASFLSTGEFIIFSFDPRQPPALYQKLVYAPIRTDDRNSPIIQAVYHHPLLITLSHTFSLSLYDVRSDTINHTHTITSFTSFPPTSLVLSTPTSTTYKLVLAYAIPVYPSHWSVGATELLISGPKMLGRSPSPPTPSSRLLKSELLPSADRISVISTRTARALDVPQGWIDESKLLSMREQWSRKVPQVVDTQTDGKWVVLAPGEHLSIASLSSSGPSLSPDLDSITSQTMNSSTTLQLYRLYLPSSNSITSPPPKLTFVRNLYGQIGPISSLALADGRCVSLGVNGSLWVWDLEAGTGAEVFLNNHEAGTVNKNLGAVAFDERRIVTSEASKVLVHRFDV